ncbi:MAG: DapH/DapD/GlmU-related protein [Nitrospinota bacterium]
MTEPERYFRSLESFGDLFEGAAHVWQAVGRLAEWVRVRVGVVPPSWDVEEREVEALRLERGLLATVGLFEAERDLRLPQQGIVIERGVRLEPGVVVKANCYICAGAELRHGAYVRGDAFIGPDAVVGHATEVKNSLFMRHAEAGHFAYVGDSLLGENANLGAGTKLANLQLRTPEEKSGGAAVTICVRVEGQLLDTGLLKLGAIVGDDTEIGCNAVTAPGTLLGPGCWVQANLTVPKGCYPGGHFLRPAAGGVSVVPRRGS